MDIHEEIKVLDHGFVRLVNHMGDDSSIVQAARTSTGLGSKGPDSDRELIRYLMRHQHTSPFEFVQFVFHCEMPIFVARQWVRHRTASINEVSGRYSILNTEFYMPEKDRIAGKGKFNKQGSEGEVEDDIKDLWLNNLDYSYEIEKDLYEQANKAGIANELTRINLPVATYTEWYWSMDLHNLLHFLKLRLDTHAQYEIRVYAEAIAKVIKQIVPVTFDAFFEYIVSSETFTADELKRLVYLIDWTRLVDMKPLDNKLEDTEFRNKLKRMG